MTDLTFEAGMAFLEGVSLTAIAEEFGTPTYVYSWPAILSAFQRFESAFSGREHVICYAVKAASNLSILKRLADLGAGFDIVSGGELARVLQTSVCPSKIVFSGVGKTRIEIEAALQAGIGCFNVESESELVLISKLAAQHKKVAPIALRVNPSIAISSHPYLSTGGADHKFGIPLAEAPMLYQSIAKDPWLAPIGVDCHIGSQMLTSEAFAAAVKAVAALCRDLFAQGIPLEHVDMGGGFGIAYEEQEKPESPNTFIKHLLENFADLPLRLLIEPGRSLVGNAGILLTQVLFLKHTPLKHFAIIDAAMNDCIRPALYDGKHRITPLTPAQTQEHFCWDIVGPICESGDFLGKSRNLALSEGQLLGIEDAGAYGFVMSSNYNSRPRPAEVLIADGGYSCIRARETIADLFASEQVG